MQKKRVEIKFVDISDRNSKGSWGESFGIDLIILEALKRNFDIVESDSPDYIFCLNPINCVKGTEYLAYPNAVRIQVSQEAVRPEFNHFDYCIGMYPEISYPERYIYIPASVLYGQSFSASYEKMRTKHINFDTQRLLKRDFCSFVVSNPAAKERIEFFNKLNARLRVDSGGRCCNNVGHIVSDKFEFESNHKFAITFENTYFGVTSERIDTAFSARTIPIYWGNPLVGNIYNEKAFINCHRYASFDEVIERVIQINNDDDEYIKILKEPALLSDKSRDDYVTKLAEFLKNIVETPKEIAIWRGKEGYPKKNEEIRKHGLEEYNKLMNRNKKISFVTSLCPKFIRKLKVSKWLKKKFWTNYC